MTTKLRSVRWLLAVAAIAVPAAGVSAARGPAQPAETPQPKVESVAAGKYLFKTYCASCHGVSATGDGPLAEAMTRKPADLTGLLQRNKGVYPADMAFQVIDGRKPVRGHGGRDMPAWGDAFLKSSQSSDEAAVQKRIQALVDFLETLQVRAGQ